MKLPDSRSAQVEGLGDVERRQKTDRWRDSGLTRPGSESREVKLEDFVLKARHRPPGFLVLGILAELFAWLFVAGGTFSIAFIPAQFFLRKRGY
jgi:hypothetical protein